MTKFALIASALVPGLIAITLRFRVTHPAAAGILLVVSLMLTVLLVRAVRARDSTNDLPFRVESLKDESDQVPAYLLTYVFPFIFLSIGGVPDLQACLVFAFFLLVLIYRTDLAVVNPLLLTFGFHLFRVQPSSGSEFVLLAKNRPIRGQTVHVVRIAERIYKLKSVQS